MTATITDYRGKAHTGLIRCWLGRRVVEIETGNGHRHIGRLRPDTRSSKPQPRCPSKVDSTR